MADPVIDLAQVRQRRDSVIRLGRNMAERLCGSIVESVHKWAERADKLASPIQPTDAEAARAIIMWAKRRLRAEVRRTLVDIPAEAQADMVETAESAFRGALISLENSREKECSR